MRLDPRIIRSQSAVEVYLTATPDPAADPQAEAARMFAAIRQEADRAGARICRQRVFVPDGRLDAYTRAWQAEGGAGREDRWCSWLRAGPVSPGGVQAHALGGSVQWSPLRDGTGAVAGWICRNGRTRWALAGGLCLPKADDDEASTREALESARRLLEQAGMTFRDVARTWFFLDDILAWYPRFNAGRNDVFRRIGLLGPDTGANPDVPASTGIGVSPACGSRLAMELFAVSGPGGCILRRPAAGRQKSAFHYGSAFARAAEALTPAGRTVFVSGTAAIDEEGRTCFLDDAPGQIRMTLRNVQAVLSDMRCGPSDVVEAIAYCKTPAIAEQFAEELRQAASPAKESAAWPWVVIVCDVCRDDLLFEIEATACQAVAR